MDTKALKMANQIIDRIGNLAITFQHNPFGASLVVLLTGIVTVAVVQA